MFTIAKRIKVTAVNAARKVSAKFKACKYAIQDNAGETYVDTGVKIIIAVVVGGVVLAGLYALFNTTILENLRTKITSMFNYTE